MRGGDFTVADSHVCLGEYLPPVWLTTVDEPHAVAPV